METSLSWVLNVAHKKRQGDAPLLSEQPGPHGHPDVTLPICNHIQKRMHWWQDTKKAVIVRQLGTGKRLRLRLVRLGKFKIGEVGMGCQGGRRCDAKGGP